MLKKNAVNLAVCAGWLFTASAVSPTNQLDIQKVTVNDKSIPLHGQTADLGAFPQHVTFLFPPGTNAAPPVRVRFKLEGFDPKWHDAPDAMTLTIRFFSTSGDQVSQNIFGVNGESPGWNGSLRTSTFTHRREELVVPPQAARFMAVISSAGPAASVGVYVVTDLAISKISSNSAPVLLLASPGDQEFDETTNRALTGWIRDGLHKSMARVVTIGEGTGQKAFAILDDDRSSHAEWRNLFETSPPVAPGDHLLVEWDEMYSIGDGSVTAAHYDNLPEGNYIFHVAESDIFGRPTGIEGHINVIVPPPFWRTAWFWSVTALSVLATVLAISRYVVWHKLRREMAYLRNQQAVQRERLRIAQDIHDDLGARVTQISLLSAMAPTRATFPDQAGEDFDKIFRMSRGLISALYETVWAVNPEKDNLEALGSYLVQQINELCKPTGLRCRLNVQDLPAEVHVSSQVRHNIYMSAKEAVHNVLKHANASEVMVQVTYVKEELAVSIRDDGCGMRSNDGANGNGLGNMKRRMNDIGGTCRVESEPGRGTTVFLRLAMASLNGEVNGKSVLTRERNGTIKE
jgi:signal transduction histidine kinase